MGFTVSSQPEPHKVRTQAILLAHPAVRGLIGRNPWSALVAVVTVALQLLIAWQLRSAPWWVVALAAYGVGAFANHALYVMIHEATHNLIFASRAANQLTALVADIPNVVPAAMSFRSYHLRHHAFQGVPELDADLPHAWEARLIGHGALGKSLWLLLFPLFQVTRPTRLREIRFLTPWTLANWGVLVISNAAILWAWGPTALVYLVLSLFFSVGLHPLGARWIQEHYLTASPQETYSYYGPANLVAFNVGYHNEHHDFPSIPWNRLPQLTALAPEFYRPLASYRSWTGLLLRWIFDRELSLFSRMIRQHRNGRTVSLDTPPAPQADGT